MSKKFQILVFSPSVIFNRTPRDEDIKSIEIAYLERVAYSLEREIITLHEGDFIARVWRQAAAAQTLSTFEKPEQLNIPLFVRDFHANIAPDDLIEMDWAALAHEMVRSLAKKYGLTEQSRREIEEELFHTTNQVAADLCNDHLDDRNLLRPWLLMVLKSADDINRENRMAAEFTPENEQEFLAIAATPHPLDSTNANSNFINRLVKLMELIKHNCVSPLTRMEIVSIPRSGSLKHVVDEGMLQKSKRLERAFGNKSPEITLVCTAQDKVWIDEARRQGHGVAIIEGHGRGKAHEYGNLDYTDLIRRAMGEPVEPSAGEDFLAALAKLRRPKLEA